MLLLVFILFDNERRSLIYKVERWRLTNDGLEMLQKEAVVVVIIEVLSP
jgi:hypothetical protein